MFVAAVEAWLTEQRLDVARDSATVLDLVAARLSVVMTPPRDVIVLYARALDRLVGVETPEARLEQVQLGARFVCLELMGMLAETYRRRLLDGAA